jgi:hypothetical protein
VVQRIKVMVLYRPFDSPRAIATDVATAPDAKRVIEWNVDGTFDADTPAYQKALGPDWRMVVDETITARSYWTWTERGSFHHREFVRVAPAATQPR